MMQAFDSKLTESDPQPPAKNDGMLARFNFSRESDIAEDRSSRQISAEHERPGRDATRDSSPLRMATDFISGMWQAIWDPRHSGTDLNGCAHSYFIQVALEAAAVAAVLHRSDKEGAYRALCMGIVLPRFHAAFLYEELFI